jgi:predicted DNA-binding antitoxin AbrB/MazE fold protein
MLVRAVYENDVLRPLEKVDLKREIWSKLKSKRTP